MGARSRTAAAGLEAGEPLDSVDGGLWSTISSYKADGSDPACGEETDPPHVTVDGDDLNTGTVDDSAAGQGRWKPELILASPCHAHPENRSKLRQHAEPKRPWRHRWLTC